MKPTTVSALPHKPPSPGIWIWLPQLIAAAIMGWVAYLKLSGGATDVAIFTQLGMESFGRVLIGLLEGICALLLVSPYAAAGAVLTQSIMLGAIIAHTTVLGVNVQGDGGVHLILLAVVFLSSLTVVLVRRRELPYIGGTF